LAAALELMAALSPAIVAAIRFLHRSRRLVVAVAARTLPEALQLAAPEAALALLAEVNPARRVQPTKVLLVVRVNPGIPTTAALVAVLAELELLRRGVVLASRRISQVVQLQGRKVAQPVELAEMQVPRIPGKVAAAVTQGVALKQAVPVS
jgi:hypothetical protein